NESARAALVATHPNIIVAEMWATIARDSFVMTSYPSKDLTAAAATSIAPTEFPRQSTFLDSRSGAAPAHGKPLQRFQPPPSVSVPKPRHSERTVSPKARDRGPKTKVPPHVGPQR